MAYAGTLVAQTSAAAREGICGGVGVPGWKRPKADDRRPDYPSVRHSLLQSNNAFSLPRSSAQDFPLHLFTYVISNTASPNMMIC